MIDPKNLTFGRGQFFQFFLLGMTLLHLDFVFAKKMKTVQYHQMIQIKSVRLKYQVQSELYLKSKMLLHFLLFPEDSSLLQHGP